MKIAVTYENGQVFQHFGHSESFKIYNTDGNKVISSSVMSTNGSGHGALAGLLSENNVDALICGGIGQGAQNALSEAGIKLFAGISGDADEAVSALMNGTLVYGTEANCSHHEHGNCEHHESDGSCSCH